MIAFAGHLVHRPEPPFLHLLAPAGPVQLDQDERAVESRKSAGGSLNAMWPFSPIPANATSIVAPPISLFSRRHSVTGLRSPKIGWNALQPDPFDEPVLAGTCGTTRDASARDPDVLVRDGRR